MTVAIGLVCSDGVLVASDSMGSNGPVASSVPKVHTFGRSPAIWTMSGSVYVGEEVELALKPLDDTGTPSTAWNGFTTPDPTAIRAKLKPAVLNAMQHAYQSALNVGPPAPGGGMVIAFPTEFLFLGFASDAPWFLEVSQIGEWNWHTEAGFYSIGSGGHFAAVANALMKHYLTEPPLLEHGKMVAYRTIATTVEVSSQYVGGRVQMAVCDNAGARILTDDELDKISDSVNVWKELERDTLFNPARGNTVEGDLPNVGDGI